MTILTELVIGSRGYGPIRRLSSTSGKLVHEAPCPVLAVTRGVQDAAGEGHDAPSAAAHAS